MGVDHPICVGGRAPEPSAKRYVVALSDVHLGTDGPTVWYQRDVHQPHLLHLLDWVLAHAEEVRELVLLGDIVDLWTYPADERPPTFADIRACHPEVLGPDGALARLLDALDGAVTYVPGNHDLGITSAEVATITSPGGHHVRLVEEAPYRPLPDDPRLAMTHGHDFTLFNAPHLRNPWAPLPVGHFITRAVATSWAERLAPGQTAADLAGQGAPNGIELSSLAAIALGLGAGSITATVVDFVAGATGVPLDRPMILPDGRTATLADAKAAYADAWTDWAMDHGGGYVGHASATRAALADLDGSYLGWFAQQLALLHGAELVVMGHTHVPISRLEGSPIQYVNTGFDCPSGPDRDRASSPQRSTFAVIDTVDLAAEIWEVADLHDTVGVDLACRPIVAGTARVASRMDFSCYVSVDNTHRRTDLERVACRATDGYFPVEPPERIPAGTTGRFWLQDILGPAGSAGTVTYTDGTATHELRVACPTFGTNAVDGAHEIATRAGDGAWKRGEVVRWGHPFFVEITI